MKLPPGGHNGRNGGRYTGGQTQYGHQRQQQSPQLSVRQTRGSRAEQSHGTGDHTQQIEDQGCAAGAGEVAAAAAALHIVGVPVRQGGKPAALALTDRIFSKQLLESHLIRLAALGAHIHGLLEDHPAPLVITHDQVAQGGPLGHLQRQPGTAAHKQQGQFSGAHAVGSHGAGDDFHFAIAQGLVPVQKRQHCQQNRHRQRHHLRNAAGAADGDVLDGQVQGNAEAFVVPQRLLIGAGDGGIRLLQSHIVGHQIGIIAAHIGGLSGEDGWHCQCKGRLFHGPGPARRHKVQFQLLACLRDLDGVLHRVGQRKGLDARKARISHQPQGLAVGDVHDLNIAIAAQLCVHAVADGKVQLRYRGGQVHVHPDSGRGPALGIHRPLGIEIGNGGRLGIYGVAGGAGGRTGVGVCAGGTAGGRGGIRVGAGNAVCTAVTGCCVRIVSGGIGGVVGRFTGGFSIGGIRVIARAGGQNRLHQNQGAKQCSNPLFHGDMSFRTD